MELDRKRGATPLYHQIETHLKGKIEDGEIVRGAALPAEKSLMQEYGVSRITVRQALNDLAKEGYVEGHPGIGTLVTYQKINESLKKVISFSDEMKLHGVTMHTSLCKVSKVFPSSTVSDELGLDYGKKCFRLDRVRCVDGKPLVYSETFCSLNWNLPLEENDYVDSLYKFISADLGIVITKAKDTLEAISANKKIAELLQIAEGYPVFKRIRKSFDKSGKVFEYTICFYPGDKYKYTVEL